MWDPSESPDPWVENHCLNAVVLKVDFRDFLGSFWGVSMDHYKSVTLTVYKWNHMNPDGSIWFHLYTVKVKGRSSNFKV